MRRVNTQFVAALMLLSAVLACRTSDERVSTNRGNVNSSVATPSAIVSPSEEKSFSFVSQGQKTITGHVYPDAQKSNGKMVLFTPLLDKSDGNLYNASLNSLWSVYGKKRGLFQLADAETKFEQTFLPEGERGCMSFDQRKEAFLDFIGSGLGCFVTIAAIVGVVVLFSQVNSCRLRQKNEAENQKFAEEQRVQAEATQREEQKRRDFESYVINFARQSHQPQLTNSPYLKLKPVSVSGPYKFEDKPANDSYNLSTFSYSFTREIPSAQSREELGMVVVRSCRDVFIGQYEERSTGIVSDGYRVDCDVTLIDHAIAAIIFKKTFRGKEPARNVTTRSYGSIKGERPDDEIEKYLKTLPRR